MTREAEQNKTRLREDTEKLRSQHEQTLATIDTKIDAMKERRTQDRLDGLLGDRGGLRNRGASSREPRGSRE